MALVVHLLLKLSAIELSIISFVAFLLFYTMYDKTKKTLVPGNLVSILTLAHGADKTLVELNKAISLSGLTVLCCAFIPLFSKHRYDLLWCAMVQLVIHSAYSVFKYYGSNNIPYISSFLNINDQKWKKVSIILGIAGQWTLAAGMWDYIYVRSLAFFGISLGVAHFYFMEIDHKMVLRVRPFAYIVFPLALLGVLYGAVWRY